MEISQNFVAFSEYMNFNIMEINLLDATKYSLWSSALKVSSNILETQTAKLDLTIKKQFCSLENHKDPIVFYLPKQ